MNYPEQSIPVMADMEFRAQGDVTTFTGYAALFNTPSDAPWLPFVETVRPGAFRASLGSKRDHGFVLNHDDNQLIASTYSKRLRLVEDERGLLVDASLTKTAAAQELRALYDAGELRGMSFTFKPTRNGLQQTKDGRELTDVVLGHVTAVSTLTPGYSQTASTVQMRALADDLSAEPADLEELFEGIRAGRVLVDEEINLLGRLNDRYHTASEPEQQPEGRSFDDWKALLAEKGILPSPEPRPESPEATTTDAASSAGTH